jgi:ferredoxin-type protein NapG
VSGGPPTRRRFLRGALKSAAVGVAWVGGLRLASFLGVSGSVGDARATAPTGQAPLRPPGVGTEAELMALCTGCYLCGEVCPPQAIRFPARVSGAQAPLLRAPGAMARQGFVEPVWSGSPAPYILPWIRSCTLCMDCTEICPTGAIEPIEESREAIEREVRMGVARIDRKLCLPWTGVSWCGACYTVCPLKGTAINVDYRDRPSIVNDGRVGCGQCVEVCPLRYKAVAVLPSFPPSSGSLRGE